MSDEPEKPRFPDINNDPTAMSVFVGIRDYLAAVEPVLAEVGRKSILAIVAGSVFGHLREKSNSVPDEHVDRAVEIANRILVASGL